MKIRKGFVSNSSSSSFIVIFTQLALDQDVMHCFDGASTISSLSKHIGQIEKDLAWSLNWCKENNKNPDKDEDVFTFRKSLDQLKRVEDKAIYIDMDRGDGETTVIDLLDLLKTMGFVENYEREY